MPRPKTGFSILRNDTLSDPRLGWAARGLLAYLLTKPDDWKVSAEHLKKQTTDARIKTGRNGIYALLGELQEVGYVAKHQCNKGRFGEVEYFVFDAPPEAETGGIPRPSRRDTEPCLPQPEASDAPPAKATLLRTEKAPRNEATKEKRVIKKEFENPP